MLNIFKPKDAPISDDSLTHAMLAELQQHTAELHYQNQELRRSIVRLETKLHKIAIALGVGDAVARS
jgi:hypothetical protein